MAPGFITPSTRYANSIRKRRFKLLASYAGDWVLTLAIGGLFIALQKVEGYRRRFSLTDTTIQYPILTTHSFAEHERVPNWLLIVICLAGPAVLMPIINLITIRSLWDSHNSLLGLTLSLALTGAITNIFKLTAGRPRPDMLSRCMPREGSMNPPVYGLVDSSICTQTDSGIMQDGFRSLISGHASLSFAGLGFLSFYLGGKLHLWDQRGHTGKAWLAVVPFMGSTLIAITRTMDFRHHATDVFFGALVGTVVAFFCYSQYFPPLSSPNSHLPYPPRFPAPEKPRGADGKGIFMGEQGTTRDLEAGNLRQRAGDTHITLEGHVRAPPIVPPPAVPPPAATNV